MHVFSSMYSSDRRSICASSISIGSGIRIVSPIMMVGSTVSKKRKTTVPPLFNMNLPYCRSRILSKVLLSHYISRETVRSTVGALLMVGCKSTTIPSDTSCRIGGRCKAVHDTYTFYTPVSLLLLFAVPRCHSTFIATAEV